MKTRNVYVYLAQYGRLGVDSLSAMSKRNAECYRATDMRNGYAVGPIVKVSVPLPEPKRAARAKGETK